MLNAHKKKKKKKKCSCCSKALVDSTGLHGLSCASNVGRHPRHKEANLEIAEALKRAGLGARLEPLGLLRTDGKRPDGITTTAWRHGKNLVWDVTCTDTFAVTYLSTACREAGAVATNAETAKRTKYSVLSQDPTLEFIPIAVETSGVFGPSALTFFKELGRRITAQTGDPFARTFLMQRISLIVQKYNAVAIYGTLGSNRSPPLSHFSCFSSPPSLPPPRAG